MSTRQVFRLFVDAGKKFSEDKATRLAAAIAYYTALSLSPLLLLVITMAGMFFGAEAARGEIQDQIRGMVGDQGAEAIEIMIASSAEKTGGTLAAVIGIVTLSSGRRASSPSSRTRSRASGRSPNGRAGPRRSAYSPCSASGSCPSRWCAGWHSC